MRTARKKHTAAIALIILCVAAIRWRAEIVTILMVFAYAAVCVVALTPLCRRLESMGIGTSLASGISILIVLLLLLLTAAVLFPYIVQHSAVFLRKNQALLISMGEEAGELFERWGVEAFRWNQITDILITGTSGLIGKLAQMGKRIAGIAGKCVFAVVIAYYWLRERNKVCCHLSLLLPIPYRRPLQHILIGCRNAAMGYFAGLIKTSLFIFFAIYAGLILLRIPDALLLALIMALLEVLPYVGPLLASVPILLSAIPFGLERTVYALILVIVVQLIEGNFAGPYFTASSTSIHPFAALAGVFVFGTFFGFWGILLAVPVLVAVRSVFWSVLQLEMLGKAEQNRNTRND